MFKTRGEKRRIDTAAKLGRAAFAEYGLENDFDTAIKAMHHYREIRNQYAHRTIYDDGTNRLALVDIEALARSPKIVQGLGNVTRDYVDVPTLKAQEVYAATTGRLIIWLNYERRTLCGEFKGQLAFGKPLLPSKPPLHI